MALPARQPDSHVVPLVRYPVTDRCRGFEICIINLADARTLADELRDAATENHTQWDKRKTAILELHMLCVKLMDRSTYVAKRIRRHARFAKTVLSTPPISEAILATLADALPDVDVAHLEARLETLLGETLTDATLLGEVSIDTGGAR